MGFWPLSVASSRSSVKRVVGNIVEYGDVLEIVAANPGIDAEKFRSRVAEEGGDPNTTEELPVDASESGDVIEADGKHWILRKGEYSYKTTTTSLRNRRR